MYIYVYIKFCYDFVGLIVVQFLVIWWIVTDFCRLFGLYISVINICLDVSFRINFKLFHFLCFGKFNVSSCSF